MHTPRSAGRRRPTSTRRSALAAMGIALSVVLGASVVGCAPAAPSDPESDALTLALLEYQSLDEAGQREALDADARELGAFLIAASGLPETAGLSAEEIEAQIPRSPALTLPDPSAPAEETPAEPALPDDLGDIDLGEFGLDGVDLGDIDMDELEGMMQGGIDADLSSARRSTGPAIQTASLAAAHTRRTTPLQEAKEAALSGIRDVVGNLQGVLLGGLDGEKTQQETVDDPETGSSITVDFKEGELSMNTSTRQSTDVGGTAADFDSGSTTSIDVCPDANGEVDGFVSVDGGISVPGPDGKPSKTLVTVTVELKATVDDNAWAVDSSGEFEGYLRTGTPNDSIGGLETVTSQTKYTGTMTINYANDEGAGHAVRSRASKVSGDKSLGEITTKIVTKLQQGVLREAEMYWRNGGCVRADVTEDPAKIDRGGESTLEVVSRPLTSGETIPNARAEYTGENRGSVGGSVILSSDDATPAIFEFLADQKDGIAMPRFKVTSKRGIGFGNAYIEVGENGWVIEGEVNGTETYAVKCDGLVGEWEVSTTGGFGYDATSHFTIGEDLSGTFAASGSVAGVGNFTDGGRVWFEARNGGYVFNIDGGNEAIIPVRKATEAECG